MGATECQREVRLILFYPKQRMKDRHDTMSKQQIQVCKNCPPPHDHTCHKKHGNVINMPKICEKTLNKG